MRDDIVKAMILVALAIATSAGSSVTTNTVGEVRQTLERVIASADKNELRSPALEEDFEFGKSHRIDMPSAGFAPLVLAVSNHWQEVFGDINAFATNITERTLLINTAWYLPEDVFLSCFSLLSDAVETGALSSAELRMFLVNSLYNHHASRAIYFNYQDPVVTNIVGRLANHNIMTNWCTSVLSGEALREYQSQLSDGLLEP